MVFLSVVMDSFERPDTFPYSKQHMHRWSRRTPMQSSGLAASVSSSVVWLDDASRSHLQCLAAGLMVFAFHDSPETSNVLCS